MWPSATNGSGVPSPSPGCDCKGPQPASSGPLKYILRLRFQPEVVSRQRSSRKAGTQLELSSERSEPEEGCMRERPGQEPEGLCAL